METSEQSNDLKDEDKDASKSESEVGQESQEKNGKIKRTLESMQEQMKVTDEEINYRTEMLDKVNSVKDHFKCTNCNVNFQSSKNRNKTVNVHPLLGVLMCDDCCDYYGDGNFSLDSDGDDKYCRWCGEGGTLFECSKCICGFCDKCIKKHFGKEVLTKVENDDDWVCYICDPKPLWYLRSLCVLAKESMNSRKEQQPKRKREQLLSDSKSKKLSKAKEDFLSEESNDESSSKSSSNISSDFQSKRKRRKIVKHKEMARRGDSSSNEEKPSRKSKPKNRSSGEGSSVVEGTPNPKKRQKMSSPNSNQGRREKERKKEAEDKETEEEKFSAKKCLVVEKLRGIWKLTESITEVGLNSSKDRLNKLTTPDYLKTMDDLEKEYRKCRSFLMSLSSTFKIACNSVSSVKLDLSPEKADEERNRFQVEEQELKRIAKVLEDDSEVEAEANDSNSAKSNGKNPQSSSQSSSSSSSSPSPSPSSSSSSSKARNAKEVTKDVNGKSPSVEVRKSLSDDETRNDEKQNEGSSGNENKENNDTVTNDGVKPMLKVKSFAKMIEDNVLDTCSNKEEEEKKESVQVDDYNAETEGSTDDEKNDQNKKKQTKKKNKVESSGSNFSDEAEETTKAAMKRVKRDRASKKRSFERFKEVREKYLKSKAEAEGENAKTKKSEVSELSDNEENTNKSPKKGRRRKMVVGSSDEENKETTEKKSDDQSGEEKSSDDDENTKEQTDSSRGDSPKKSSSSSSETSNDESGEQSKKSAEKKGENDSNESSDEDEDEKQQQKKKRKREKREKGKRRNISKILKKDSLQLETKEALKKEEERRKRVEERNKLFEKLFPEMQVKDSELPKEVILDFDPETKKPLVTVHKKLVKKLKPHQVKGVKFMWDNCFESVKRLEEDHGTGCILAHCMGLGKTLQVVTLVHTVMNHDLGVHTVLILCPLSTVNNWVSEFEMWLGNIKTEPIIIYNLIRYKKMEERYYYLMNWHKNGGVLVVSYDLFRILTKEPSAKERRKNKKKMVKVFEETLLDPGPDLIVCDEGHLLKNEDTALSKCMNRVKTSRRIILTGTPLQNNLMEYHCMVQFVKPNILGTKKEFSNRFVNPINNGQFEDSTELDVKIMKRRSHVLHSMLSGCVQRFDYSVLTPFLPEKHEYVLLISLTETQAKVYRNFINNLSAKATGTSKAATLFNDYHNLQRIWTHPRTMLMHSKKEKMKDVDEDSEGSLKDFIVSDDEESTAESSDESSSSVEEVQPKKRILRSNANDEDVKKMIEEEEKAMNRQWWDDFFQESDFKDIRASNKLVILFALLQRCAEVNDKVLVFSQSLYSLNLIEYFLNKIDEDSDEPENELLGGYRDRWLLGLDYFRLDGSTTSDVRTLWCNNFNEESNKRARLFLISTRAGGLGINLFAANRVVIFDASWNPSHDVQSIFRVYRFGQKKTCYIYRFLAEGTMEEKIYERQVTKLSLAHRVVDEHQIERHYSMMNLQELYTYKPTPENQRKVPKLPKDKVFADILSTHKNIIVGYHEHDSLLENQQEEELSEEERKAAWKEYEAEKENKGFVVVDAAELQRRLQMQGIIPQSSQMPYFTQIPQTQAFRIAAPTTLRFITPAGLTTNAPVMVQGYVNPVNTVYTTTSIPIQVLQRGVQLGVTPLPNESTESYFNRIKNRENWLEMGQGPRET